MTDIPFIEDKIYLDGSATQPLPQVVIDKLTELNTNSVINPNLEYDADGFNELHVKYMGVICEFMGIASDELVFGKSTTELINNVARQIKTLIESDQEIVISDEEHNANWLPWKEALGHKLVIMEYDKIPKYCSNHNVGLVSVAHTTNVTGETRDLERLCDHLNSRTILVVDGCQHAPHVTKLDIPDRVDMYVFSGHKMHAPKGIAVAMIRYGLNDLLKPFLYGGGNIADVDGRYVVYDEFDNKHRAGTQDWNSVIALSTAIEYRRNLDLNSHRTLREFFVHLIKDLDVTIYNKDIDSTTVVFNFNTIDNYTAMVGSINNDYGFVSNNIYVRQGQMCNVLTMEKLNIDSCLRISFSHYNTYNDVIETVKVIKNIIKIHGGSNE